MRDYHQELRLRDDGGDDKREAGKGKGIHRFVPQQERDDGTNSVYLALPGDADRISTLGSIRSKMLKVFKRDKAPESEVPPRPTGSGSGRPPRVSTDDTASTTSTTSTPSSHSEQHQTPRFDPSTNANPLFDPDESRNRPNPSNKNRNDLSKHTFYIENSQMKLTLNAKNERQMLQWTTALEKAATTCRFARRSRFDSFAPVRSNVAVQWLVDGVRDFTALFHPRTHAREL